MRVLIIYHDGATRSSREIFKAISRRGGLSLSVIVPRERQVERVYEPSGWLRVESEEERDGYRLIPVPLRDPTSYCRGYTVGRLYSVMKALKPDIIHVLDEPWSYCLLQAICLKLVALWRSKVLFYGFENLTVRLQGISRLLWPLAWRGIAGGMAANSEQLSHLRRLGFPGDRQLRRVFWGIPTSVFRRLERPPMRRQLGLDCDYLVGFVGRFAPEKGLRILCDAMLHLPPEVHCLLIGNGPLRSELESAAMETALKGRVHLLNSMAAEALARYLNCMDVMAVPSLTTPHWKEQYGRVIGEGMACGVPIVGSDSGAIPEVIGTAGLVVPEGDAVALAGAVTTLLFSRETRERLGEEGLRRAHENLSCDAMARRLVEFYGEVLGNEAWC